MPEPLVLTIACLVFAFTLALLGDATLGHWRVGAPRCRTCGRDARGAIFVEGAACPGCGTRLDRAGAIKIAGRRRSGARVLVTSVGLACALAVIATDRWLASHRLQWSDVRPARWDLPEFGGRGWELRVEAMIRRATAGVLPREVADEVIRRALDEADDQYLLWLGPVWVASWNEELLARLIAERLIPALDFEKSDSSIWPVIAVSPEDFGMQLFFQLERLTLDGEDVLASHTAFRRGVSGKLAWCSSRDEPFEILALWKDEERTFEGSLRLVLTAPFPALDSMPEGPEVELKKYGVPVVATTVRFRCTVSHESKRFPEVSIESVEWRP